VLTLVLLATNRENRRGFFDIRRLRPGGSAALAAGGNGSARPVAPIPAGHSKTDGSSARREL